MVEISLHILDIVRNSIKAEATEIGISVVEDTKKNLLAVEITDNGKGMSEEFVKNVTDPFVTMRKTRKVGLGLSLFKSAAELTGGGLEIQSKLGEGTKVTATFVYDSIDRMPLGDTAFTMVTLVSCNPDIDFVYTHTYNGKSFEFSTKKIKEVLNGVFIGEQDVLHWIEEYIADGLCEIKK